MSKEKSKISIRLNRIWHPINIYNKFKKIYFSIIPKGSKGYDFTHSIINIFLKQLKFFNIYYREWIKRFDTLSEKDIRAITNEIHLLEKKPAFSVVMPVYNPPPDLLEQAIQSVINQLYPYWELCIADDASTDPCIAPLLLEYAEKDERIKTVFREENGHISAASNSALELASNEFIALLDHDDIFHPLALYYTAKEINQHPDSIVIYSDEDKITRRGKRLDPYFKPDFDYELLLSQNMISHLGVYRTSAVRDVGGFRVGLEGSQDYDLVLRVLDNCKPNQIHHIPRPLYHWRTIRESAARNLNIKPYAIDAATKALNDHLIRRSIDGRVTFLPDLAGYHISYELPDQIPMITIVILCEHLSSGLYNTADEILSNTNYKNLKIMIGSAETSEEDINKIPRHLQETIRIYHPGKSQSITYPQLVNQCLKTVSSDFVCLMDESLTGFKPGWLNDLIGQSLQQGVGVVGPKIINTKNNRVESNGIVFLADKAPQHLSKGEEKELNGYFGWGKLTRGYSALSNMCLVFNRNHIEAVSGFDEILHDPLYCSVDFCLKLKELGYRNILRPMVELYIPKQHILNPTFKTQTQQMEQDQVFLENRWDKWLQNDPGFNPNLEIIDEKFLINLNLNRTASRKKT